MNKEIINIVDEQGTHLFKTSKEEAHEKGLLHIVGVTLIFNSRGKILLTRGAENRPDAGIYFHPSGGHIGSDEDLKEGTLRELKEELGIENPSQVAFLGNFIHYREIKGQKENHMFFVFKVVWDGPIKLGNEAIDFRWFSKEELKEELGKNPEKFSDPLKMSLQLFVFGPKRE